MDLKVKASGRARFIMAWYYPLNFDPQGAFLHKYNVSLLPKEEGAQNALVLDSVRVLPLCPCHDYYLDFCHDCHRVYNVFTRDKAWLFTLFLLLLPFRRANRSPIVNALTGAHPSQEMLRVVKYPACRSLLPSP